MMLQKNSNPWMRSKVLYVIPAAVVALSAFATPKFSTPIREAVNHLENKGKENSALLQTDGQEINSKALTEELKTKQSETPTEDVATTSEGKTDLTDDRHLAFTEEATIIVDGKEITKEVAQKLTMKDIRNVSVLKDPASRALYGKDTKPTVVVIETFKNEEEIMDKPEILPEYKGGTAEMFGWLSKNIKYPKEALDQGVQGRLMVQFVVEKDGNVSNVKAVGLDGERATDGVTLSEVMVNAYGKNRNQFASDEEYQERERAYAKGINSLIAEGERVVKQTSGHWEPGYTTIAGRKKAVRTKFVLPIMFRLN